jgi:hypothetical protein
MPSWLSDASTVDRAGWNSFLRLVNVILSRPIL